MFSFPNVLALIFAFTSSSINAAQSPQGVSGDHFLEHQPTILPHLISVPHVSQSIAVLAPRTTTQQNSSILTLNQPSRHWLPDNQWPFSLHFRNGRFGRSIFRVTFDNPGPLPVSGQIDLCREVAAHKIYKDYVQRAHAKTPAARSFVEHSTANLGFTWRLEIEDNPDFDPWNSLNQAMNQVFLTVFSTACRSLSVAVEIQEGNSYIELAQFALVVILPPDQRSPSGRWSTTRYYDISGFSNIKIFVPSGGSGSIISTTDPVYTYWQVGMFHNAIGYFASLDPRFTCDPDRYPRGGPRALHLGLRIKTVVITDFFTNAHMVAVLRALRNLIYNKGAIKGEFFIVAKQAGKADILIAKLDMIWPRS